VVIDLSDVPLLDATVSLAIENSIKDAIEARRQVFLVSPARETKQFLEGVGIFELLPTDHLMYDRTEALRRAVSVVDTRPNTVSLPDGAAAGAAI
jgi:SulP family sulfate permease